MPPTPPTPIDEQAKIYLKLLETGNQNMVDQCILNGLIDLPKVKFYLAQEAFVTSDPETLVVKRNAVLLSNRNEPVLITGESGTGKELLANILHGIRRGFFVPVNVCAVTDTLFESELFGHKRGSFTGADRDRAGLIAQAEEGTLFLDEIGDMPFPLQSKLLRVINNRVYREVGGNEDKSVKCRIVAATHVDLKSEIAEKKFRLDLYERLNVFRLDIKPLRDRIPDTHLFTTEEEHKLLWPDAHITGLSGNVRQLLNLKLRLSVLGKESITKEDLQ